MHYVFGQAIYTADLRDHERRVFRLDAKHHAHFQLHREPVFRNHFKGIEGIDDFARGPFNGLAVSHNIGVIARRVNGPRAKSSIPSIL